MHPFFRATGVCGCWLDSSIVVFFCSLHPLIVSHYHHVLPIFHSGASSLARGACVILKIAFTKYLPSTRKKRNKKSNTCLLAIYAFRYNDICRPFAVVLFGRSVKNDPLAQYAPQLKMLRIHFFGCNIVALFELVRIFRE